MLVLEMKLDEGAHLTDRATGDLLCTIKIASIVQYPAYTKICLGFDAPQSTYIKRFTNGEKDLTDGKAKDTAGNS